MTRASRKHHAAIATLLAAAVAAGGGPALAQHRPPPPVAAQATPPPTDVARATAFFQKGSELLKAKKFTQALEQFRQSYATVASPNSHLYIARCLASLGETRAAYLEFDNVVDEATLRALTEPKYVPARDSARAERDELAPRLGLVTINVAHAEPGSAVRAGPYPVPSDRWGRPFPVDPGTLDARVETPGRPTVRMSLTVGPGERREVTLDVAAGRPPIAIAPPPPPPRSKLNPLRVGGFVAAGVGVVGFAMFAGGGVTSSSTFSDLKTKCGGTNGGCPGVNTTTVTDEINKGKTQQAIANAGLGLGIVGVAAGATLIVLSTRSRQRDAAGRPSADLVVGPSWLGAQGEF